MLVSAFHTDARCKSIAEYRRIEDRCYGTVEGHGGANLCRPRASEPGGHETAQAMPPYLTTTDPPSSSTIAARAISIGERCRCGYGCDVAAHQTRDRLGVAIPRSWNNGVGMGPPPAPQTLRSASGTFLASKSRTIGAFSGRMVDVRPGSSATFESSYLYQSELTKGSKASVTRTPKTTRRNFSGNGEICRRKFSPVGCRASVLPSI